ncbi:MAG: PASTA domain-containing protein [Acidobacteriota bacterium]|nr:PASTA domain-containing protein [Acidobacteriota bacterium]
MNTATGALSALRRLGIAIAIAVVFLFGLATTVYLSLRSPEVTVPEVVGKDRFEAERILGDAGLKFRVRATRPSSELKADTVLFQLPRPGEVVKAGQTVAMDISRSTKEGESSVVVAPEKTGDDNKNESFSTNANTNENKPKRNKNTNKNDNENANTANRNANSNRAANKNANTGNSNGNSNRPASIINNNSRSTVNQNGTVRPPVTKPSPVAQPSKENP